MKHTAILLFALLPTLLLAGGNDDKKADAPMWAIDGSHSAVTFTVNHFFTPVNGAFNKYDAKLKFDPNNLAGSSVDVTVDVSSVDTKIEKRDNHLMSGDFFNAEEYPNMRFVSTSFEKVGDNEFVAKGKLTIKDTTKDFELPFKFLGAADHPWQEGKIVGGLSSSFVIKRNDYGVGTGDWVATTVIGDDVTVNITLEVTRKK